MTTNYTKITKATGTSYTRVSGGYHIYDDVVDTYDSANVLYDGLNGMSSWTKLTKPSNGSTASAGLFIGLGALTYSGGQNVQGGIWTKITKAT